MKGQKNQAIIIYNILRKLGLNPKTRGIKILTSAIIIAVNYSDDFIIISNIYKELAVQYKVTPHTIKTTIAYTLHNLVGNDYKENFQELFGIKYCEDLYTNQIIIEEVSRIITMQNI